MRDCLEKAFNELVGYKMSGPGHGQNPAMQQGMGMQGGYGGGGGAMYNQGTSNPYNQRY